MKKENKEKGIVTSLRLTPTLLLKFKQLGGHKWLKIVLNDNIEMDKKNDGN